LKYVLCQRSDGGNWREALAFATLPVGFSCHRKTVLSVKPDTKGDTTIDGVPTSDNRKGFCRARLMEVTPEKEIVFDMWIDGSGENPALSLSSFRAEFVGESK
jgi:hypothetical protein